MNSNELNKGLRLFLLTFLVTSWSLATTAGEGKLSNWTYIKADADRTHTPGPKARGFFGLGFGDLNGDGYQDLVSGPYFYRNPGGTMESTPWPRVSLPRDPETGILVDADHLFSLNGNGRKASVIAQVLPNIIWMEAEDPEGERWVARVIGQMPRTRHGNGRMVRRAHIVPGNERPDLLLTGGNGTYLMEIPDDPIREEWPMTQISHTEFDEQKAIGIGDIDRDGHLDLALSEGHKRSGVQWWRNPGDGSSYWNKYIVGETINASKMMELVDVNGDGLLDIVATDSENPNSGLFWFEAPQDPFRGKWKRHLIDDGYNGLDSMSVVDMTGDGKPDIVVGETIGKLRLVIYENSGGDRPSWKKHLIDEGKESHKGAMAVDLDGDGDLDLVSVGYFDYKSLHIWRNDNG